MVVPASPGIVQDMSMESESLPCVVIASNSPGQRRKKKCTEAGDRPVAEIVPKQARPTYPRHRPTSPGFPQQSWIYFQIFQTFSNKNSLCSPAMSWTGHNCSIMFHYVPFLHISSKRFQKFQKQSETRSSSFVVHKCPQEVPRYYQPISIYINLEHFEIQLTSTDHEWPWYTMIDIDWPLFWRPT